MTYNADIIFDAWIKRVEEDLGTARFSGSNRDEYLDEISRMFYNAKIPYDDALGFSNRVMLFFTTKEGRKNKGKHTGWKDRVDSIYRGSLATYYVNDIETSDRPVAQNKKIFGQNGVIEKQPDISEWVNKKFSGDESIMTEAHIVGSCYHLNFMNETYGDAE